MNQDTTIQAHRERFKALRRMGGARRLEEALELSEVVRQLAKAGAAARTRTRDKPEAA